MGLFSKLLGAAQNQNGGNALDALKKIANAIENQANAAEKPQNTHPTPAAPVNEYREPAEPSPSGWS